MVAVELLASAPVPLRLAGVVWCGFTSAPAPTALAWRSRHSARLLTRWLRLAAKRTTALLWLN
jgi:hypothetical protein